MSHEGFYKKHHHISQTLLQTIYASLEDAIGDRDHLTKADLKAAFEKLNMYWPKVGPLFRQTCTECAQSRKYKRDSRRTDLLTRLVFSRIMVEVPARPLGGDTVYPKVLAPSVQKNLSAMLSPNEWEVLNEHAIRIFEYLGSDDDSRIWENVKKDETLAILVDKVFISILMRFKNFNIRMREFFRITGFAVDENIYKLSNQDFCEVFEAMFGKLSEDSATEEGRLKIRLSHGEETLEKMQVIFAAYFRYRQGVPTARKVA